MEIVEAIDTASGLSVKTAWPGGIDLTATLLFLLAAFAVPAMGYVFMVLDVRAYLRSLRRSLTVVRSYISGIPGWARRRTPSAISALGLSLPCTEEDLLRAYRQRVKTLHPDRGGDRRKFLRLQRDFEQAAQFLEQQEPSVAKRGVRN
ncbi:MAG: hypothetical protein ACC645_07640 [Pirellulales bacterium]